MNIKMKFHPGAAVEEAGFVRIISLPPKAGYEDYRVGIKQEIREGLSNWTFVVQEKEGSAWQDRYFFLGLQCDARQDYEMWLERTIEEITFDDIPIWESPKIDDIT